MIGPLSYHQGLGIVVGYHSNSPTGNRFWIWKPSGHPALTCLSRGSSRLYSTAYCTRRIFQANIPYSQQPQPQSQCRPIRIRTSPAQCRSPLQIPLFQFLHLLTPATEQSLYLFPPPVWLPQRFSLCASMKNYRPSCGAHSLPSPRAPERGGRRCLGRSTRRRRTACSVSL